MRRLAWALCLNWIVASSAWAGPPELFTSVVDGRDASSLVVFYDYGGGGLYVSRDKGRSFGLLCSALVERDMRDGAVWAHRERPDGRMYFGTFDGLVASDSSNCNWNRVAAFEGKWISDLVRDPEDANVTYAITSSGSSLNALYRNDGRSDAWTRLGEETSLFLSRVHAVKTPSGVRFYLSATVAAQSVMEKPRYSIRVSEDHGASWVDHAFEVNDGQVRLLAVDPANPDRIVVGVMREGSATPDDVWWSAARGEPGTFQKIGQVMTLGGVAFTADGALLYADNEQGTPGLFRVDSLGAAPRRLSSDKIGCLRFDAANARLYACRDWLFGAVDPSTGAFTMLADMRAAEQFVGCPDEAGTAKLCEAQFLVNYCGPGHYPDAPLCLKHYATGGMAAAGAGGAAGMLAGSGGAGAGGATEVGGAPAADGGSAQSPMPPGAAKVGSGCSVGDGHGHGHGHGHGEMWLVVGLAVISWYRKRWV